MTPRGSGVLGNLQGSNLPPASPLQGHREQSTARSSLTRVKLCRVGRNLRDVNRPGFPRDSSARPVSARTAIDEGIVRGRARPWKYGLCIREEPLAQRGSRSRPALGGTVLWALALVAVGGCTASHTLDAGPSDAGETGGPCMTDSGHLPPSCFRWRDHCCNPYNSGRATCGPLVEWVCPAGYRFECPVGSWCAVGSPDASIDAPPPPITDASPGAVSDGSGGAVTEAGPAGSPECAVACDAGEVCVHGYYTHDPPPPLPDGGVCTSGMQRYQRCWSESDQCRPVPDGCVAEPACSCPALSPTSGLWPIGCECRSDGTYDCYNIGI